MIQHKELYKQLINNIGEQIKKTLNEDLVTKQKNYTNKTKFYHGSVEKISKIKDLPMFCFFDRNEVMALCKNLSEEYGEPCYLYSFNINGRILSYNQTIDIIEDDILMDLTCNLSEKELRQYIQEIKKCINDDSVVGITVLDYSQRNFDDDAYSVFIFNPNESIINWKCVKTVNIR